MLEANLKIIEELRLFVSLVKEEPEVLSVFSIVRNAFIRTRKLPFEKLVLLIAKLCKKTLSAEIDDFFEELSDSSSCSVSAFAQGRMKLHPAFFLLWNQLLTRCFYYYHKDQVKRWKGYRIVAGDGSNISLVNTPELHRYFGGQANQLVSFVQAKAFYCYDVLNEIILFPQIRPYRFGELMMAYNNICNLEDDMLMIYDRLYCNYKMIALHLWQEKEIKFVIRGNESQLFVQEFIAGGQTNKIVYMKPTRYAIKGLMEHGYKIDNNTLLKVRLVKVSLENSVEVLITNLWEEEGYATSEFKDLYFKRWGIETNIGHQKNILRLESFSGLTARSVEQDFFATAFIANLHAILIKESQAIVDEAYTKRKYPVKINKNKSFGKLRKYIVALFIDLNPKNILLLLNAYFIRDPIIIRKGRYFKRRVKNKQFKSKHKTYMNYKPAF